MFNDVSKQPKILCDEIQMFNKQCLIVWPELYSCDLFDLFKELYNYSYAILQLWKINAIATVVIKQYKELILWKDYPV